MHPDQIDRLVASMRRAARDLTERRSIRDVEATLGQIVASAVDTVPGIDAGSISLTRRGQVETRVPTSEVIGTLDDIQGELFEGPCISAIEAPPESGVVISCDFASAQDAGRWPQFAPRAVEFGYRALISTTLSVASGPRAALNLYSVTPNAFDRTTRAMVSLFGAQAGVLLYGSDTAAHLQRAVDSRDLIGQAKGILMERFKINDDAAFRMLVTSSQDTNMKLNAVAQWLCDSIGR